MIAAGLTGLPLLCSPALAQTQLPGIVVQGATLASPQPTASAPAQSPGPAAPAPGDAAATDGAQGTIAGVPGYTVGNAVTVVTGEELRAQQVRHAAEALRSLPGVSVNRGGGRPGARSLSGRTRALSARRLQRGALHDDSRQLDLGKSRLGQQRQSGEPGRNQA